MLTTRQHSDHKSRNAGFTLLEMTIATAVSMMLFVMVGGIWANAARAWVVEDNYMQVSAEMRSAMQSLSSELSVASVGDVPLAAPPVEGVALTGDPATAVTFQTPTSADGLTWSAPITIQLRNEDANGDLLMSGGEDDDDNGLLDRVIERVQDMNGDGDTTDAGEVRVLARSVDTLTFVQNGNRISANIVVRILPRGSSEIPLVSTTSFDILVLN
jgi:type II secretory pathway pseudopilin PulG